MSDGPFGKPKEPDTPGRGRYGGVSPLIEGMGDDKDKKPKTSDPYFKPPDNGQPGRGKPYLEPPAIPGAPKDPPKEPPKEPGKEPGKGPTIPDTPAFNVPPNTPDWGSPQPYGGKENFGLGKGAGQTDLERNLGSKSKALLSARDRQNGSDAGKALIAGITTPLLAEPTTKLMGLGADKLARLEGTGLLSRTGRGAGNLWMNNYDPVGIHASQVAKEESLVTKSFDGIRTSYDMDQKVLAHLRQPGARTEALVGAELKHAVELKLQLKISEDSQLVKVLVEREGHLNPEILKSMTAEKTVEHINRVRASELSAGGRILTKAELGYLETRAVALTKIGQQDALAKGAQADAAWMTTKGTWTNFKKGVFYTLGTGAALNGDHSLRDRIYGKDATSWETSSLTVPLAMALGKGFGGKTLLTVGALGLGHLADNGVTAPKWIPEPLKHFTVYDAVPMGLAFAVPAKGKWARAGLVGLAWLGGNSAEWALSKPTAGSIEENAVDAATRDRSERSYDSMEGAVKAFKELGKKNEIIMEQNLANLIVRARKDYGNMNDEQKLGSHRATIALARSVGEHRLENGTRLSAAATDHPTYVLKGLDLDLGAESLMNLQMARDSTKAARVFTTRLMDLQAFGTVVTGQELDDLDKIGVKVDGSIQKIVGKHDIQEAYDQLKKFIDFGTTSNGATFQKELGFHKTFIEEMNVKIARNVVRLKNPDGTPNADAVTITAKLFRDQALAKMAEAGYKLDHGNDPGGATAIVMGTPEGRNEQLPGLKGPKQYDGVMDMLGVAEQLDPKNPDLPELKALAKRLEEQCKLRAPEQYKNYKSNPLGVKP